MSAPSRRSRKRKGFKVEKVVRDNQVFAGRWCGKDCILKLTHHQEVKVAEYLQRIDHSRVPKIYAASLQIDRRVPEGLRVATGPQAYIIMERLPVLYEWGGMLSNKTFASIYAGLQSLWVAGVRVGDLHSGNIGSRVKDGPILFFDFEAWERVPWVARTDLMPFSLARVMNFVFDMEFSNGMEEAEVKAMKN